MKLIECYIESFGKLKNRRFNFTEGLNCVLAENGWGKSTLAAFIKVMLYGMSDTKKTSLEENERRHYLPWDGSRAGGTLTFCAHGKEYRIERSFAPKAADDTFTLYDLRVGKVTADFSERLGEELFGIDADGFERTVYLSERNLTPKSDNRSVSAKLSDLVGCDGDIGVMDEAMKRLEDGRKFYYKKGGAGELANIKRQLIETRTKLDHIEDTEALADAAEKKIALLRADVELLSKTKAELGKEREAIAIASAKEDIGKRYRELGEEIRELLKKKNELSNFFGNKPPKYSDIDAAYLKLAEAESLENAVHGKTESDEYRELCRLFSATDEAEISAVRDAIFEIKRRKSMKNSSESQRMLNRFTKRIPTHRELDEMISLASKPVKPQNKTVNAALFGVGAFLLVLSFCLGLFVNFAFLCILAPAVLCILIPFIGKRGTSKNDRRASLEDFYYSISDRPAPEDEHLLHDLIELKTYIDKVAALREYGESDGAEKTILAFVKKFSQSFGDAVSFAEEMLEKYSRLSALSEAEKYRSREAASSLEKARRLREEAKAFADQYPTVEDDPFKELRKKLSDLERIEEDIVAKKSEAENYVKKYGTSPDSCSSQRPLKEIERDSLLTEEKINTTEREIALTEKLLTEYSRELDEKDRITIKLSELEDLLSKHTENYEVILKTKEYLEKAKDSMTSKYLGKTKAGFEKYTALISGHNDGRFEMATDFGISKLEGASSRSPDAYSRGTRDLYNLSARLALSDALYENEKPFIILDDPFVSFDDAKVQAALALLEKLGEKRQIIYFTCSESRYAKST